MRPENIVFDAGTPDGTRALRRYLEYARDGRLHYDEGIATERSAESDFESAVGEVIRNAGYAVEYQVGVAGFRIDLGVRHPLRPTVFMAGIECDGATYHSGITVRDRDRIRQDILESLGWKGRLWRIWSTDWFRNPAGEMAKLMSFLNDLASATPDVSHLDTPEQEASEDFDSAEVAAVAKTASSLISDAEVEVGDCVSYVHIDVDPSAIHQVQIVERAQDIASGMIARHTPLAAVLLGAQVGEMVELRVPGQPVKRLLIKAISKPN
jgi:transcription elongation GreA/GreB family factor